MLHHGYCASSAVEASVLNALRSRTEITEFLLADEYACTTDTCEPSAATKDNGGCKNYPVNAKCDDKVACSKDECVPSTATKANGGCKYTPVDEDCSGACHDSCI